MHTRCSSPSDVISIHAPHARSDVFCFFQIACSYISIHAPHARSDERMCKLFTPGLIFQSTLLMRGATCCALSRAVCRLYFNPRSSCEERRRSRRLALRFRNFNPRSSCEERPAARKCIGIATRRISIHAPHARSDIQMLDGTGPAAQISIHAPHARSDLRISRRGLIVVISIHAPHARSD